MPEQNQTIAPGLPKKPDLPPAPKSLKWMRGLAAILFLLLLGSIAVNFYYYSKYMEYKKLYNNESFEIKRR